MEVFEPGFGGISPDLKEIYRGMGYGDAEPDEGMPLFPPGIFSWRRTGKTRAKRLTILRKPFTINVSARGKPRRSRSAGRRVRERFGTAGGTGGKESVHPACVFHKKAVAMIRTGKNRAEDFRRARHFIGGTHDNARQ